MPETYFAVAVGSFDPSFGTALRSELPALDPAGAAVAAAQWRSLQKQYAHKKGIAFKAKAGRRQTASSARKILGGAEIAEQEALFGEAKKAVIAARSILEWA